MNKYSIAEIKEQLSDIMSLDDARLVNLRRDERKGVQKLIKQVEVQFAKKEQIKQAHLERLSFERALRKEGFQYIAGIDEVGRGPLAGPVVTAAVILPENCDALIGVTDSKQLSHEKRQAYVELIKEHALAYTITVTPVEVIDRVNIYEATRQSMLESVSALTIKPEYLLIDAMQLSIDIPQESLIKGDQRSLSIAAASIIAKEYRDQLMVAYAQQYPEFGFEQHMGYGTKQHLEMLSQYGYTPIHRKSFAPISQMSRVYKQ